MGKKYIQPGSQDFKHLLKEAHILISEILDNKVRMGIHEPGHGSSHMEMTLYYFRQLADMVNLPAEQKDLVSLAAILHDIWRENIDHSHTIMSAKVAEELLNSHDLFCEKFPLNDETKNLIVKFILLHSNKSSRKRKINFPSEWSLALIALQASDMIAQAGAFGYLRSFSYSGHVLKRMFDRIKFVVKNPKKFQEKLPDNLKKFLSISDNFLHGWILSILKKTNTNYLKILKDDKMMQFASKLMDKGVSSNLMSDLIHVNFEDNKIKTFENERTIEHKSHDIVMQTLDLLDQSRLYYNYFNEFINDLDLFSLNGIINESNVNEEVENDIMIMLEYSIPGLCSRAFWGQFNPKLDKEKSISTNEYPTLPERLSVFLRILKKFEGVPQNIGMMTEEGIRLFDKVYDNTLGLVSSALHQYHTQRWTIDMW